MSGGRRAQTLAALLELRSRTADRARQELAREVASLAKIELERRALDDRLCVLMAAQVQGERSWRALSGDVGPAHRLQSAVRRAAWIRSLRSQAEAWRVEQRGRAAAAEAAVTQTRAALARVEGERRAVDDLLAKLRRERARYLEGAEESETAATGPVRRDLLSRASS